MQLNIRSVSKSFGDRAILLNANASFRVFESVALVGPSGSGKTTILSLLAGVEVPDSGSLEFTENGIVVPRPSFSWLVQSSPLLTRRTVHENVLLGALSRGKTLQASVVASLLTKLGIESLSDTPVRKLSGGERQRVTIARALAAGDKLILADEPTASLDGPRRDAVTEILIAAANAGALVIIATHDHDVGSKCTRTVKIENGAFTDAKI